MYIQFDHHTLLPFESFFFFWFSSETLREGKVGKKKSKLGCQTRRQLCGKHLVFGVSNPVHIDMHVLCTVLNGDEMHCNASARESFPTTRMDPPGSH